MMIYDTAVIGTGPAGLSAAINLKLHNKEVIWFGSRRLSTKVEKSEKIANYPGFGYIPGEELTEKFREHAELMGLEVTEEMVTAVMPMGDTFMLSAGTEVYTARTILLAAGTGSGKGFEGEEEMLGRGVSYCATCDGFLYRGKTVGVLCQDERFEHEAEYLAELAETVWLYPAYKGGKYGRGGSLTAGEEKTAGYGEKGNIRILPSGIRALLGDGHLTGIRLTNGEEIAIDGLFCLRNAIAPATLLKGLPMDGPHIVTDRNMRTGIPGVYAAGDCTGRPYQVAKAVGEGNIAAHSIVEDLAKS